MYSSLGLICTAGIYDRRNCRMTKDADVVKNLRDAGKERKLQLMHLSTFIHAQSERVAQNCAASPLHGDHFGATLKNAHTI